MWPGLGAMTVTPSGPWLHDQGWTTCLGYAIKQQSQEGSTYHPCWISFICRFRYIHSVPFSPLLFALRGWLVWHTPWFSLALWLRVGFGQCGTPLRDQGKTEDKVKVIIPSLRAAATWLCPMPLRPHSLWSGPLHIACVPGSGNFFFPHLFMLGGLTTPYHY